MSINLRNWPNSKAPVCANAAYVRPRRLARVRVGFAGAGAISEHHLAVLGGQPGVEIAAICDLDEARARGVAERVGARAFTDWEEMLAADVLDALFVCTPPAHHAAPAIAALARRLAVYLEKPLARSRADGEAIVEAWERSGAVCAIGYQWRSLDVLDELRAILGNAKPGLLVSRSFGPTEGARRDLERAATWFADPAASGGLLFELASHDIDLQIALAGPVESVQARASSGLLALAGGRSSALDDAVSVLLSFTSGGYRLVPRRVDHRAGPAALRPRRAERRRRAAAGPRPRLRVARTRSRRRGLHDRDRPPTRLVGHPFPRRRAQRRSGRRALQPRGCARHAAHPARVRAGDRERRARRRLTPFLRASRGSAAGRRWRPSPRSRTCRWSVRSRGRRPWWR